MFEQSCLLMLFSSDGWQGHLLRRARSLRVFVPLTLGYVLLIPVGLRLFGGHAVDLMMLPIAVTAALFGLGPALVSVPVAFGVLWIIKPALGLPDAHLVSVQHLLLLVGPAIGFGLLGTSIRRLARSEARLRGIVGSAPNAIITVSADGRIVLFNPAAERMFGFKAAAMLGQRLDRLLPEAGRGPHAQQVRDYLRGGPAPRHIAHPRSLTGRRASGEEFPVAVSLSRVDVDGQTLATVILRDETERRQSEERMRHLALSDRLTDLPNAVLFRDRLQHAVVQAQRGASTFAVLMLDMDDLTDINVTLGHATGDLVLREVAARLRDLVRSIDTVARFEGDEFALLLPETDAATAAAVAERIEQDLRRSFRTADRSVDIGASLGIAVYPDHGASGDTLIKHAEVAMYQAKRRNGTSRVYSPSGHPDFIDKALVADLRQTIDNGQVRLAFQPEVSLRSGELVRLEALARWDHPTHGAIPPQRFVALAERSGLAGLLTRQVLERGVRQMGEWGRRGHPIAVAFNLTSRDVIDADLRDFVVRLIERYGVAPSTLSFEITETALLADLDRARQRLGALRSLGVSLAIDDFGTGYSSLAYLSTLPVSEVKIDASFIRRLRSDRAARATVNAAASLAHTLRLGVIAEGVERVEQLDLLRTLGCDIAQGYYISRPLDPAGVVEWLAGRSPGVPSARKGAPPLARPVAAL